MICATMVYRHTHIHTDSFSPAILFVQPAELKAVEQIVVKVKFSVSGRPRPVLYYTVNHKNVTFYF